MLTTTRSHDLSRTSFALLLALLAASCGGQSPAAPTPPPPPRPAQVGGSWAGLLSSNFPDHPFRMALNQINTDVTGTWAANDWTGTISGTVDTTRFAGTFTFSAPTPTGVVCTGTAAFTGPAGGTSMTWTAPGIGGSNCTNAPLALTIKVSR